MRMPFHHFLRAPAISRGMFWLLLAGLLSACASKNPLMEEPVVAGKESREATSAQSAQSAAPMPAEPAPAARETAKAGAATSSDPGVQTVKKRRWFGFLSPYRPDIQQGNFVSQEMVSQVREGMTPDQVRFVLGTPLLTDMFHAERWDYPFRMIKGNGEITSSRVTVFFKDNRVARIEGGQLPTEEDYLARIAGDAPPVTSKPVPSPASKAPPSTANEPQ